MEGIAYSAAGLIFITCISPELFHTAVTFCIWLALLSNGIAALIEAHRRTS